MAKQDKLIFNSEVEVQGSLRVGEDVVIGDKSIQETIKDNSVGKTTELGGEIFNDYENNKALSEFSHSEGSKAVAGSKAFGFNEEYYARTDIDFESVDKLDNNKGWYHLNSTAGIKEAIDRAKADTSIKELKYTVLLTNNYDFRGVIEDVDDEENKILVTNFLMPNDKNPSTGKLIAGQVLRTDVEHGINRAYILLVDYNDIGDIIIGEYSHAEGDNTCAAARASHAEGRDTKAVGKHSHTEGRGTYAAYCAHAEGQNTVASGDSSHTEGVGSKSSGFASHAENEKTVASGKNSHAQGKQTTASGENSFAASQSTTASGTNSSAFGYSTVASGENSVATGERTIASGKNSHAHGANSIASIGNQFVVGYNNKQDDEAVFIVGNGQASTEEGRNNAFTVKKDGRASITVNPVEEGDLTPKCYVDSAINDKSISILNYVDQKDTSIKTQISAVKDAIVGIKTSDGGEVFNHYTTNQAGQYAHAEGRETTASGNASHAEGIYTVASNSQAHAEGFQTEASGEKAHAEGHQSRATGSYSHAEGYKSDADGIASHAEGYDTTSGGQGAHSEGYQTTALGTGTHAGGVTSKAFAHYSFAHGKGVIAGSESNKYLGEAQTVLGKYNKIDTNNKLFIIGGGTDDSHRANVFTIDKDGKTVVGEPTLDTHATTKKYVDDADAVLDSKLTEVEAIAKGASAGLVFKTVEEMNQYINSRALESSYPEVLPVGSYLVMSGIFETYTYYPGEEYGYAPDEPFVITPENMYVNYNVDVCMPMGCENRKNGRFYQVFQITKECSLGDIGLRCFGAGPGIEHDFPITRIVFVAESDFTEVKPEYYASHDIPFAASMFIEDVDVPDYWWNGSKACELETRKVVLTDYATKTYVDSKHYSVESTTFSVVIDNNIEFTAGRYDQTLKETVDSYGGDCTFYQTTQSDIYLPKGVHNIKIEYLPDTLSNNESFFNDNAFIVEVGGGDQSIPLHRGDNIITLDSDFYGFFVMPYEVSYDWYYGDDGLCSSDEPSAKFPTVLVYKSPDRSIEMTNNREHRIIIDDYRNMDLNISASFPTNLGIDSTYESKLICHIKNAVVNIPKDNFKYFDGDIKFDSKNKESSYELTFRWDGFNIYCIKQQLY